MNISKYKKEKVLAALYNNAKVQGMGVWQAENKAMTPDEADKILEESNDKYFDYLKGRVMKISLVKDEVDTFLYNRDNGVNAAENVLAGLEL